MKLAKLCIQNFRSCRDLSIDFEEIHAIVGANNSGKSSILHAMDFLFNPSTRRITAETFWAGDTTQKIRVEATFSALSSSEKLNLATYVMPNGEFKLARIAEFTEDELSDDDEASNINITQEACKIVPKVAWLREDEINTANIEMWWAKKENLKIGTCDFQAELGTKKPGVTLWKEKAAGVLKRLTLEDLEEAWIPNPKGYSGVLKGNLPMFILVPAVRNVSDEAKGTKSSPFGKLLKALISGLTEEERVKMQSVLGSVGSKLNRTGGAERISQIANEEVKLSKAVQKIFIGCDVELEFPTPNIESLMAAPRIYIDDGFRGAIENKGHGLQRAVIFCILQRYADLVTGGEMSRKRSLMIAVEEPELYMHPQAQRTVRKLFQNIAKNGDQVVFTTHSSWLVDVAHFDEIIRVESSPAVGEKLKTLCTRVHQLPMSRMIGDIETRHPKLLGKVTASSMRELYSHIYNPGRNEGFFAKRIALVEGQTEQYALPIYATALGFGFDELGISIIECGTKGTMDRFYRIFNELGIPCFLLFDYDKGNTDKKTTDKSKELLKLVDKPEGEPSSLFVSEVAACFVTKWETELAKEIPNLPALTADARAALGAQGSKPLEARYIATKLTAQEPPVVPPSVKAILESLVKVEWQNSCLHSTVA